MITKHPIYQDFPEFADKIKNLYHNNDEPVDLAWGPDKRHSDVRGLA